MMSRLKLTVPIRRYGLSAGDRHYVIVLVPDEQTWTCSSPDTRPDAGTIDVADDCICPGWISAAQFRQAGATQAHSERRNRSRPGALEHAGPTTQMRSTGTRHGLHLRLGQASRARP